MTEQAMREAFEKDAKLLPCEKLRIPETGRYEDIVTEGEWRGWQAALQWAAEGQEPVAWVQPDHLAKAKEAPFLCRVEPQQRDDFVPLYAAPVPNELQAEIERLRAHYENVEATHRVTLREVQAETMRLQAKVDRLRKALEQMSTTEPCDCGCPEGSKPISMKPHEYYALAKAALDKEE